MLTNVFAVFVFEKMRCTDFIFTVLTSKT